jgi:hypothetical protein
MNGAESLLRTLVASGVEVCFGNPGSSEMHFVSALDRVDGMRAVLGLFEGVGEAGRGHGRGRHASEHDRQSRRGPQIRYRRQRSPTDRSIVLISATEPGEKRS